MDDSTSSRFQKVAERLGWSAHGGLELAEKELMKSVGKSRRCAMRGQGSDPAVTADSPTGLQLSDSESSGKENNGVKGQWLPKEMLLDSSDDDFDFILEKTTVKPGARRPLCPSVKNSCDKSSSAQVEISDSDDSFENFLIRVRTPKAKPATVRNFGSDDSLKQFIVVSCSSDEDFVMDQRKKKEASRGNPKTRKPAKKVPPAAKHPTPQWESPVFESDEDVAIKSTWKSRHNVRGPQFSSQVTEEQSSAVKSRPTPLVLPPLFSCHTPILLGKSSSDSEEEFHSLVERLKRNHSVKIGTPTAKPVHHMTVSESMPKPSILVPPARGSKTSGGGEKPSQTGKRAQSVNTPVRPVNRPAASQTEPRVASSSRSVACKTPGCFLQSLSLPGSVYQRNFKQTKEELTGRLYQLYNGTIFEGKLPADMSVGWNKKMRKTAGYCITGQERRTGSRYARIELSEKVCDSADRLRDTLVHEMCHAATWLVNGVRDGHGSFWKVYARKATLAHPELPVVTRCHSYDINYKYHYQCSRCKNTIGRHSKSLDTQRFVCALCTGQLVLLTPSKPRGPTPFASFVKEHYGSVRQELSGKGHAEVMRKLSADFAAKTQLSRS